MPPFLYTQRRISIAEGDNRISGRNETVRASPTCFPVLAHQLADRAYADGTIEARRREVAAVLFAQYGEGCRIFPSTWPIDFATDALGSIATVTLGSMQSEYLRRLESLEEPSATHSADCAASVADLLASNYRYHVTWLPIGGIRFATRSIASSSVEFTELTTLELGELMAPQDVLSRPRLGAHPMVATGVAGIHERYAMTIRDRCKKEEQPLASTLPRRMILALQLMGFELCGVGFAHTYAQPGFSDSYGGQQFRLRPSGVTRDCSQEEFNEAVSLAKAIPGSAFERSKSAIDIALYRFSLAATEEGHSEALLDYTIAMEAVLLPNSQNELAYRFALHGSRWLAAEQPERIALFDKLRAIYKTRSALVHGTAPELEAVIRVCESAAGLSRKILIKAILEGCPSREDFHRLALG